MRRVSNHRMSVAATDPIPFPPRSQASRTAEDKTRSVPAAARSLGCELSFREVLMVFKIEN
jgi:hypothetical protein